MAQFAGVEAAAAWARAMLEHPARQVQADGGLGPRAVSKVSIRPVPEPRSTRARSVPRPPPPG
jgi:hypothetical protein